MVKIEGTSVSTYQQCYKPLNSPPPIKYLQLPSLVHKGVLQQPPREFPVEPIGPQRLLNLDPEGPVVGLGSKVINVEKFLDAKPITGSIPPGDVPCAIPSPASERKPARRSRSEFVNVDKPRAFQTKFGSMNSALVDRLVQRVRWTSTTTAAAKEACLIFPKITPPKTTIETKADMIRLGGQRYEHEASEWQRAAVVWDQVQPRGVVMHNDLQERTYSQPEKLLNKRRRAGEVRSINTPFIRQLIREDQLAKIYVRQCPGYSGFTPRAPPEGQMQRRPEQPHMVSTMRANYRQLPLEEYRKQDFARQGPLSKTVTLTYPFNPYNKITTKTPEY